MRASAVTLVSLAMIGCGGGYSPEGVVESSLSGPGITNRADGITCIGIGPRGAPPPTTLTDPSGGARGYVIWGTLPFFFDGGGRRAYVGLDPTLSSVTWRAVGWDDTTTHDFYYGLRSTIPFARVINPALGQVGSDNTDTGGNNDPWEEICFKTSWIADLSNQLCQPETAGQACSSVNAECGGVLNNCKLPVDCGGCGFNEVCQGNTCGCKPRKCPKGMYQSDDCTCQSGQPI